MFAVEIVVALIVGLMVGAAVLIGASTLRAREHARTERAMREVIVRYSSSQARETSRARPRRAAPSLLDRLTPEREKERFRRNLLLAGIADSDGVDRVLFQKAIGLLVGVTLGLVVGVIGGGWWLWALPILGVAGLYFPELLIQGKRDERTEAIATGLPDALDLMHLAVAAGLGIQAALQHVAETEEGPVAEEFGRVLQEIQLGIPRAEAFRALADRVKQPDLIRFAQAMVQVDRLGIPVSRVLDEQSRDMRARRMARAEEQAQKVSVKILGPLMLCFLPALMLVVLTPAVLGFLASS